MRLTFILFISCLAAFAQAPISTVRAPFMKFYQAAPTPALVQNVGINSSGNGGVNPNRMIASRTFTYPMPWQGLAGNTVVLMFSSFTTSAGTISGVGDDQGNKWSFGTYGYGNGRGLWIYYATNIAANTRIVTITNGTVAMSNMVGQIAEFNNVLAYHPLDVTNTFNTSSSSGTMSAGSITPTVTNDLIVTFGVRTDAGVPTSYTAGSQTSITWNLLYADLVGQIDGNVGQYGVYNSTAAINPQFTLTPNAQYIAGSIALKPSATAQGSAPSGFRIVALPHIGFVNSGPTIGVFQAPIPTNCNLLVESISGSFQWYSTNVTDNQNNTWTEVGAPITMGASGVAGASDMWYATNATCAPTMWITNKWKSTSSGHGTIFLYGIIGAEPGPNAFDYYCGQWWTNNGAGDNGISDNIIFASPSLFQPSVTNEIVIINTEQDYLTVTNIYAGGVMDGVTWIGNNQDGPSSLDQNNGWSHYVASPTTNGFTQTWLYTNNPTRSLQNWTTIAGGFMPPGSTRGIQTAMVQETNTVIGSSPGTASQKVAFPKNNKAGNLLVVCVQGGTQTASITVTDLLQNTYTPAISATSDGNGNNLAVYYATNCASGANTVGVAQSVTASLIMSIMEIQGMAKHAPVDATATSTTTSTTHTSGNITTTFYNDVLVAFLEDPNNGGEWTAKAGWGIIDAWTSDDFLQIQLAPTPGSYGAQTIGAASGPAQQCIVAFHP